MRRFAAYILIAMLTVILSGCIVSQTPSSPYIVMTLGEQKTFSMKTFPSNATYAWTLDGVPLSNTGNSYMYTAKSGIHNLMVKVIHKFGVDIKIWLVTTLPIDSPISILLNSLVSIPGGTFDMGSTDGSWGYDQITTPVHMVTLSGFSMGAYEVTQAQYAAVMGINPSSYLDEGHDNCPVEQVTWNAARIFCAKLSTMTGRNFTLPSEAQWEYACRAGTTTLYSYGDQDELLDEYACFNDNACGLGLGFCHPMTVGIRKPNAWGLYDMHGNVLEWCMDSWHNTYTGAPTDGNAWISENNSRRVVRGGGYASASFLCRSAMRFCQEPDKGNCGIGFRIVEVPAGS